MRPNLIIQARVNQRYVHTSLRHWFTHSDLELLLYSDFSGAEALTRCRRARSARGPESQHDLGSGFFWWRECVGWGGDGLYIRVLLDRTG